MLHSIQMWKNTVVMYMSDYTIDKASLFGPHIIYSVYYKYTLILFSVASLTVDVRGGGFGGYSFCAGFVAPP